MQTHLHSMHSISIPFIPTSIPFIPTSIPFIPTSIPFIPTSIPFIPPPFHAYRPSFHACPPPFHIVQGAHMDHHAADVCHLTHPTLHDTSEDCWIAQVPHLSLPLWVATTHVAQELKSSCEKLVPVPAHRAVVKETPHQMDHLV